MAGKPTSSLRQLLSELQGSLTLSNIYQVAVHMWSAGHLNDQDLQEIKKHQVSGKAMEELMMYVLKKEETRSKGLAKALIDIERPDLATKITEAAVSAVQSAQPASHHPPAASTLQLAQIGGQSEAKSLYAAVLLRMSMRRTYLEVQVLVHSDEQVLRRWQQAGKNKDSHQQDMPLPELVTLSGFSADNIISARLTSIVCGGPALYHHGWRETTPDQQPPDNMVGKPRAWLFQLADQPREDTRQFFLHLHKASPVLAPPSDTTWSDEICKTFTFPDHQGSCFLYPLGFTLDNQPSLAEAAGAANFGRPETAGGVQAAKTMSNIIKHAQSVGLIRGPVEGTGFCIGKNNNKYIMTCHHVIAKHEQDIKEKKFTISFSDLYNGSPSSFVLTKCVAMDEQLDYAILEMKDAEKAPPAISCCSTDFERLTKENDVPDRYLSIVGYYNRILTVDVAVDWVTPTPSGITLVKNDVLRRWPHLQRYLGDYDIMNAFAKDVVFYNVARHKHGSSGSPVLLCQPDHSVKLVALHRRGFPDFYYNEQTKGQSQGVIPIEYTVEAGTRLSAIYENLRRKNEPLCQEIFDIETQPMEEC